MKPDPEAEAARERARVARDILTEYVERCRTVCLGDRGEQPVLPADGLLVGMIAAALRDAACDAPRKAGRHARVHKAHLAAGAA